MSIKRLEALRDLISEVYDGLQTLQIQSTARNVNALSVGLANLQTAYNTLTLMREEQTEGDDDGRDVDAE